MRGCARVLIRARMYGEHEKLRPSIQIRVAVTTLRRTTNVSSKLKTTIAMVALVLTELFSPGVTAAAGADAIASRTAEVDGLKIHYLTAGHGPAVILLHGYTQTSRMWRPLIPQLADRFTVIAPDLPGIGDSEIPKDGLDMKNAAIRMHALIKSLGIQKVRVVGHDIGLMVAY